MVPRHVYAYEPAFISSCSRGDAGGVTAVPRPGSRQNRVFLTGPFSCRVCGDSPWYFESKHNLSLTLNKGFLCRNLTSTSPQFCHNISKNVNVKKRKVSVRVRFADACKSHSFFWRAGRVEAEEEK